MLRPQDQTHVESQYRLYGGLVYRRCLRILQDRDEARAAVQEVFVRYMGQLEQASQVGHPRAYLFRTATNHCLNRLRDRKPWEELDHESLLGPLGADPAGLVEGRRRLLEKLERLTEEERLLVWLHFAEGMTQGEIAEVLSVSRKTVNKKLGELSRRLALPAGGEVGHA